MFGGRNPWSGSSLGKPVAGSSDKKRQVKRPVTVLRLPAARTMTFRVGRMSTSIEKSGVWVGVGTTKSPKLTGPKENVERSNRSTSSWSLMTTSCAGAVASGLFSKRIW